MSLFDFTMVVGFFMMISNFITWVETRRCRSLSVTKISPTHALQRDTHHVFIFYGSKAHNYIAILLYLIELGPTLF